MNLNRKRQLCNRRGIVLFLIVAIVLMLTLLTYGYLISMRTQNLAAAQSGDQIQARQAAYSAQELVSSILEGSLSSRFELGDETSNESLFRKIVLVLDEEEDEWTDVGFVLADQTETRFGLENQSGKINLATLLDNDQRIPGWGRECLLRLPNMTETMADHILDWIDSDDEPREFGAESEFYLENAEVLPRNAVPPNLDELALIPDITPELIYGKQRSTLRTGNNRAENADTGGQAPDGVGWDKYLTVHSGERNETFEGSSRINLNSSDLFELHSQLVEVTDVEIANFVVLARQYGMSQAEPSSDSNNAMTIGSAGQQTIDFTIPPSTEFESKLDVFAAWVSITTESGDDENLTLVQSPLGRVSSTLDELSERFLDGTTTTESMTHWGRVNLMIAPLEVLLSVPGIDETLAEQILTGRDSRKQNAKTCFWLMADGLITMEKMKQLEPMITNRGEICRFICGGWSDRRSAPIVFEVVLDATEGVARKLYSRRILETGWIRSLVETSDPR